MADSRGDFGGAARGGRGHLAARRPDRQPPRSRCDAPDRHAAFHLGAPSDRAPSIAVLRRAVELGVNHIDTAAFYFSRFAPPTSSSTPRSPPSPTRSSRPKSARAVTGPVSGWAGPGRTSCAATSRRTCASSAVTTSTWSTCAPCGGIVADHFGALAALRDEGLIRHLGVSEVTVAQLAEARAVAPVVSVQNRYGLGRHRAHECSAPAASGIAFVPFFAIAGARASGAQQPPRRGPARSEAHAATARSPSGLDPPRAPTSWPSPAPATRPTWTPTSPPARCACHRGDGRPGGHLLTRGPSGLARAGRGSRRLRHPSLTVRWFGLASSGRPLSKGRRDEVLRRDEGPGWRPPRRLPL